jgi:hypothetical protein
MPIEKTWIADNNNANRCSVEYWGSEEKARAALATLSWIQDQSRAILRQQRRCDGGYEAPRGEVCMIDDKLVARFLDSWPEISSAITSGLDPSLCDQQDAVLVRAMAEQALEDASIVDSLLDAGCSFDEVAAAFSDGR